MTTPNPPRAAVPAQPDALLHAAGLEYFAESLPAYGFDPQPLKKAAATMRSLHAQVATLTAQGAAERAVPVGGRPCKVGGPCVQTSTSACACSELPPDPQDSNTTAPATAPEKTDNQRRKEVLNRLQQQEDGHNCNPFRPLIERLMANKGSYTTTEIGQLKWALDGFYGARAAPVSAAPEYVGNGMFKGETIQKAAEHWANWCDRRCMTGLSEFLRVVAACPAFWTPEQIEAAKESAEKFSPWLASAPQPLAPASTADAMDASASHAQAPAGATVQFGHCADCGRSNTLDHPNCNGPTAQAAPAAGAVAGPPESWQPGQQWQCRPRMEAWKDIPKSEKPMWLPHVDYRRHPECRHPSPTPAAQASTPLKDHQIAALVNELRDIAVKFHATQQLRERIAHVVVPALRAGSDSGVQEDAARVFPELKPELAGILGTMCFQCITFAQALRAAGHQIKTRAEDEQAAVLHWMLGHYFRYGEDGWRAAAAEDMKRMQAAALAAKG